MLSLFHLNRRTPKQYHCPLLCGPHKPGVSRQQFTSGNAYSFIFGPPFSGVRSISRKDNSSRIIDLTAV
jgi:hypothetical protein